MLSVQEEELSRGLRRELVVLLHLSREDYALHPPREVLQRALGGLREVSGTLVAYSRKHAALKISVPPLLSSKRLRGVISGCLKEAFSKDLPISLRLPGELADTLEAAKDLRQDWPQEGTAVLCLTDEAAVGEPTRPLSEMKRFMRDSIQEPMIMTFPMNHYDVLCLWAGPVEGLIWGPEKVIAQSFSQLTKTSVSSTARSLEALDELMGLFLS